MNTDEAHKFEDEVRRIARQLWSSAAYDGAIMADGRERDGVFITEDNVHLVECTTSRKKEKATHDVKKLSDLAATMRIKYPDKAVMCWFITLEEPTADQRSVVKSRIASPHSAAPINALSFEQFRRKLIDTREYLSLRKRYKFGSMEPGEAAADRFVYIEPDILDRKDSRLTITDLINGLQKGERFLILGDYGVGKSTTMREIFLKMSGQVLDKPRSRFPVHLNLRDHFGQVSPAEALERHSRDIGFPYPHHLVRAWRAGYVTLLLDGFDEIGKAGWSGNASRLGQLRYDSMLLIRKFISESPENCGLAVAGRSSYFNGEVERGKSLGLDHRFSTLKLIDFTDNQVEKYLSQKGLEWHKIPAWLPSRPLLLGYLASRGLLEVATDLYSTLDPAFGWDHLLQRICEREARIEFGVDGDTIRLLIERLASKARADIEGLGPLQPAEIYDTFLEICKFAPDDQSIVLVNRLPGLGAPRSEDGARNFVDQSLAEAARAGDVTRYIANPYGLENAEFDEWEHTLTPTGRDVVAFQCVRHKLSAGQLSTAMEQAIKRNHYVLGADVIQVAQELDFAYRGSQLYIRGVFHSEIAIGETLNNYSALEYQDCVVQTLGIAPNCDPALLPRFKKCTFGTIEDRISEGDLPAGVFVDCDFQEFANPAQTSRAILTLDLQLGQRVLLVVLKKLYVQSGSGRKESALKRGLDQKERALVPHVLKLLKQEGLVTEAKGATHPIWLPARSESARARQLLASPSSTSDNLMSKAAELTRE